MLALGSYAARDGRVPAGRTSTKESSWVVGIGVLLLVLGLILLFAVGISGRPCRMSSTPPPWAAFLVIAGVLSLVLGLVMNNQRSKTTHVEERRDV